jgi:sugar transferase (PEP-CTERM/EpsH1 system associated)
MQILVLTPRLPYPPNRGDRLRAFNFIKHLSQEHKLSLVSFIADQSEQELLPSLADYCQELRVLQMGPAHSTVSVACNLWRSDPFQILYYRSQAMHRLVDRVLRENNFDVVYVHLFRMAPYVAHWSQSYRIVDLTDVISQEVVRSLPYRGLLSRLIYRMDRSRIERYERLVAESFEETWLISEADRQILSRDCLDANIQIVTNGIDREHFYPTDQPCKPNHLIFVGHLRVFHNVDGARHLVQDILPLVRRQIPDCTLEVVGADPGPQVRRLADNPAVTVTGFVPDLNTYLNRAAVFVAPLRFAAGVQNKVLEAMATARPVVTTSVVNAGLGAQPGHEILVADDAPTAAEQIVTLLRDGDLRARIGTAGLRFVRDKYRWEHVVRRMRAIQGLLTAGQTGIQAN